MKKNLQIKDQNQQPEYEQLLGKISGTYTTGHTYGMNSQLFVSQYQLYLPDKNDLINLVNSVVSSEDKSYKEN